MQLMDPVSIPDNLQYVRTMPLVFCEMVEGRGPPQNVMSSPGQHIGQYART